MVKGTLGQLLVNEVLPDELKNYDRVLDKKGMTSLLSEVAKKYPEKYREISYRFLEIGRDGAQESGGLSFGLQHLKKSKVSAEARVRLKQQLNRILENEQLSPENKRNAITDFIGKEVVSQQDAVYEEALKDNNPLAYQVLSGSRGNKMNLSTLLGSDLLYTDNKNRPIPFPVWNSYSEGLSPAEYWAGAYGARQGVTAAKFATQDSGFLSKQTNQATHRLIVEDEDEEDDGDEDRPIRGIPVDTDDEDNEGALLAAPIGPYPRNTRLTPKLLAYLKTKGHDKILIRSPVVSHAPAGGIYARDAGVREQGRLPGKGSAVGMQASQAISEPLTQSQLGAKHHGGVAGAAKGLTGFAAIDQLLQSPKVFRGGASHASKDGTVGKIEEAPAGGHFVHIEGVKHYVPQEMELQVKIGDRVEAGDTLSDGVPIPSLITEHKGIGEGRVYFAQAMRRAMKNAGVNANRRNLEMLARGVLNHVEMTEEFDEYVPDDIVNYSEIERRWQPREGHVKLPTIQAAGKYLERPVLHYSIGTKIKPSMFENFKRFGVQNLTVHDNPPPFKPKMIRAMYSAHHDPDWMTKFYGSGLKEGLLDSVHHGAVSDEAGSSFVPSLAKGVNFGSTPGGVIKAPELGAELPEPALDKLGSENPQPSPKPPAPPKLQTAAPTNNNNLWTGAFKPMAQQVVQQANNALPGMGGALGLGLTLNSKALGTLTQGAPKATAPAASSPASPASGQPVHQPTGTGQPANNATDNPWTSGAPPLTPNSDNNIFSGFSMKPLQAVPGMVYAGIGASGVQQGLQYTGVGRAVPAAGYALDAGSTAVKTPAQRAQEAEQTLDDYNKGDAYARAGQAIYHGTNALLSPVDSVSRTANVLNNTGVENNNLAKNIATNELNPKNTTTNLDTVIDNFVSQYTKSNPARPFESIEDIKYVTRNNPELARSLQRTLDNAYSSYGGTEYSGPAEFAGAKMLDNNVYQQLSKALAQRVNKRMPTNPQTYSPPKPTLPVQSPFLDFNRAPGTVKNFQEQNSLNAPPISEAELQRILQTISSR